ncbi:hypothetical protein GNF51_14400 [Clostridium perfringens]|uniref:hypothetical protein n=1 Tax=Clostridium perfringens TaxID=1502 RepID=UPI002AC656B2|nr:hypothetical protein [Clostridium perfringens]MDZ4956968.1 hypothetical protein [Clostridium perfringens]
MKGKKLLSTVLIGCMAMGSVACGSKGDDKTGSSSPADNKAKITVQVEKDWVPYYNQVIV